MVVFDTVVEVACNTGFRHANGQLAKFLRCLDSQTWNDTFLDCQGIAIRPSVRLFVSVAVKSNKHVGPPYCRADMYVGRVACCLLVSHGETKGKEKVFISRSGMDHTVLSANTPCKYLSFVSVHQMAPLLTKVGDIQLQLIYTHLSTPKG